MDLLETQTVNQAGVEKDNHFAHWLWARGNNPGKGTQRRFRRTVGGRALFTLYEAPWLGPGLTPVVTDLPCKERKLNG